MSEDIAWEDQRIFLAVLEEGSLSAAARLLGVTQPTVRTRLAALERMLGTTLFTRSITGLTPTEQARALAESARSMARASAQFVRLAYSPPGEIAGSVRIGVSEFVGIEVLPAMLASLRATHPRIVAEVSLSNNAADLLEQEVDLAVRMHPPTQSALVARKVGAIALGLFAHRDYLARHGVPGSADALLQHALIGPDRCRADLAFATVLHPELGRAQLSVRTDSHPAQLTLARAGLGIVVAQCPVARAHPDLVQVLPELVLPALETWIVTHEDLRNVPRVRAVFDHLAGAFQAYLQS
ncbi:LysR family transcriptional regulator [Xanthomonas codiaei]|uniref:LysR family transcriptional regulator n=1 Tax=Xanthomonas codiaei TaxID=56463 RepID=A0A2S7CD70_9XANT|nr:LysR family transcriptional regulator [Xanthomonas codiaei]PPU59453.1 LysR family transcriptional regulator [Xanthomonas codiaei]